MHEIIRDGIDRRRHQHADTAADDFPGRITKQLFCRRIKQLDVTGTIHGDNRIDGSIENGLGRLEALLQFHFGAFAMSNIKDNAQIPCHLVAVFRANRCDRYTHRQALALARNISPLTGFRAFPFG